MAAQAKLLLPVKWLLLVSSVHSWLVALFLPCECMRSFYAAEAEFVHDAGQGVR